MFSALWPLFKAVFKILNMNACHFFSTDDLMSSTSEKRSFLSILSSFVNRSQLEPSQGSTTDHPYHAKNCDTRSEKFAGDLSW
jgi:hypothetical protein